MSMQVNTILILISIFTICTIVTLWIDLIMHLWYNMIQKLKSFTLHNIYTIINHMKLSIYLIKKSIFILKMNSITKLFLLLIYKINRIIC